MRSFKTFITEAYLDSIGSTTYQNEYFDKVHPEIFVNPSQREFTSLMRFDCVRAIIVDKHTVYCFRMECLHYVVVDYFKLKDPVSVTIYPDRRDIHIDVTDCTKRGIWHHNPEIETYIKSNTYLSRAFNIESISYYDEAIVGDWAELDQEK